MADKESRPTLSTGIDAISIERVGRAAARKAFLERVFTEKEMLYSLKHRDAYRRLAGRFAAKEACLKALLTGMGKGVDLKDIEVVSGKESGKPVLELHGLAKSRLEGRTAHLSITYSEKYAFAFVVLG
ncbi:MAG TPA: holo-ACP synthase [Thermodesulfobacteriota bacterium]|nr:holo-ACP synthase [Thermodesulfobacteriota bacterium]